MARIPRATCGQCSSCTAFPLSSEQYRQTLKDAKEGTPEQVAYANQILNLEVIPFFCIAEQKLMLLPT